jgi:hypothetical protein
VKLADFDADGIDIPASGLGRVLPTTSRALGSIPVSPDYSGIERAAGHAVDGSFRVIEAAITSRPAQGDVYRAGETVEVTMALSAAAYADRSVVAIRIGSATGGPNYRAARYVSGSGTDRLIYAYRVQPTDFDAAGVSIDTGGPRSGFGGRLPTTGAELGAVAVSRTYPGVPADAAHQVDGAAIVVFGAPTYAISEDGRAASVTVSLRDDPHRRVIIPIVATPGGGATAADYSLAPTTLVFVAGETMHRVMVAAIDDREADGGEMVRLGFGTLPAGVRAGSQEFAFVVIDDNDGSEPTASITDVDGGREPGGVGFTVTLTETSSLDVSMDWAIASDTAAAGGSPAMAGTLTIPARETAATVSVPASDLPPGEDADGGRVRHFSVTLRNPMNAVFADGERISTALLPVRTRSLQELAAPVVTSVPETAGNLVVSWDPAGGTAPRGYELVYRVRGADSWSERQPVGLALQLPILFLEPDTEYEARVRPVYDDTAGAAYSYGPWSESGYGRTGVDQPDSQPVVTLALADADPVTEGEDVRFHVLVSELRNSYQWRGTSGGISVGLVYDWGTGGTMLPVSSQFGVVPGVFTVDHALGGHREHYVRLPEFAAGHGPLTVTVQPGDGYEVGAIASVCASIADSETLAATPCPERGDPIRVGTSATLEVHDAAAIEAAEASISFRVTLRGAVSEPVTVDWATADDTATAGQDYEASSGTLTFATGDTARAIAVTVLDDAHDEGEETFALRLSNAAGAELADAEATGTIANSDPMPRAWLGRFGRMAFEHTLGAVDQRLRGVRTPGHRVVTRASVAGRDVRGAEAELAGAVERANHGGRAAWAGESGEPAARVSGRELLAGSEFQAALRSAGGGAGAVTLWGQGAYGRFAGRDGDFAVTGDVATGVLGVDYAIGPWLAGLALSHSAGWGSYSRSAVAGGEVTSSLTGAYPYVGVEVAPGLLSLWLTGGYGWGGLRLEASGGEAPETEIGMWAGAAGARATLLRAGTGGGPSLGLEVDALLLRATSEETDGLAAAAADVNRVRLGLEGVYELVLGGGARLTPSINVGLRRDGGTLDRGFGIDVGGGLRYAHSGLGLSLGLAGRALLMHETAELAEWSVSGWLAWDPNPASALGPELTVSPAWGARSGGGAKDLWSRDTLAGLAGGAPGPNGGGRVDAKLAYGMPLGFGVGLPWAGIGASEHAHTYRLGYAIEAGDRTGTDVRVELVAARHEPVNAQAEHTVSVNSRVSW